MTYVTPLYETPRYRRFLTWCHRTGKQVTWAEYARWRGSGEPAHRDKCAGTVLDRVVRWEMIAAGQLPLFEVKG